MTTEYPGNSKNPIVQTAGVADKKIESVVAGKVISRKKSLSKRFLETFVSGDTPRSVFDYVIFEVLIPELKTTISDMAQQALERTLFGEVRSPARRGYSRAGTSGYTSYNQYAARGVQRPDPRAAGLSRQSRSNHEFDEILLATRAEADVVVDRLYDLLQRYDHVSVSEFYDLVGQTGDYTDRKYGWTSLEGTGVVRTKEGYLISLPKPEVLK